MLPRYGRSRAPSLQMAPCAPKQKTPPEGAIIETAGSSARSAAAAADTHTPLPTVHRTVGIAATRRPAFSRLVARSKKKRHPEGCLLFWSGRRGSNSLPRPWQGRALPDELRPRNGIDYSASHRCCQPRIYYFTVNLPAPFPPGRGPLPAFPPFPRSPWAPPPSAGSR